GAPECLEISSRIRAGNFHGSGCTLSAAVAVACANGLAMADAVTQAITYTEACIDHAWTAHPGVHFMRWHPHGKS
ncbi:MAG: bifunctional hydroxymethylpyrimidine kinase/phosphomethylpyrimidine kinase, partial [Proteobacteria bacterium]|nr:bifunctional hydroxymethylpyrimidine kinase/phosphomethylpyrimidine kinase [Pseudomonadota bacterium]